MGIVVSDVIITENVVMITINHENIVVHLFVNDNCTKYHIGKQPLEKFILMAIFAYQDLYFYDVLLCCFDLPAFMASSVISSK